MESRFAENMMIFSSYDEALTAASREATQTMSTAIPGVLYQQADRSMIATSLPIQYLAYAVRIDSAVKGKDPSESRNRPIMTKQVDVIRQYLEKEKRYILPPITLNTKTQLRCFTTKTNAPIVSVIILIPQGFQFWVTDGQHRIMAIREALVGRPDLANDAVSVTLVLEDDMDQVHQDFADCAQTKPIPSSLLAVFNQRHSMSHLLKRISDEVPVFRGRIEKTSQTIGKNSSQLFTLNQIRFCAAEALLGNSVITAVELEKSAAERLEGNEGKEREDTIIRFYNTFAENNTVWHDIADELRREKVDIPGLRQTHIHLIATGLQVISRVAYYIFQQEDAEVDTYIKKLAELDYRRKAPIWSHSIVDPETDKISTNNFPVRQAVRDVKLAIGLPLTAADLALDKNNKKALPEP